MTYDLHVHSCLSPCGDEEMTPYNLVNLAALMGTNILALTDHNTTGNCRSAIKAGKQAGVLVLPGMELCTSEETHIVCLFGDIDRAEAFGEYVYAQLPPVHNRPEVFGRQTRMDETDRELGEDELLLVTASAISIEQVVSLCRDYGGFCYPAHIDRSSFSVLSSLGTISETWGFTHAEVSARGSIDRLKRKHPMLKAMRILRSSDAHNLEDLAAHRPLELPGLQAAAPADVIRWLLENDTQKNRE